MPGSAKSKPPVHVYDSKGKWLGFLPTKEVALAWIKRTKKKGVKVTDTPPPRAEPPGAEPCGPGGLCAFEDGVLVRTDDGCPTHSKRPGVASETSTLVDAGLDKALKKAKAKK